MKIQDPLDVKIKTNVCVRSLLEFGFPKEYIAAELHVPLDRVTEAESMFGGPDSFPPPVTDSMQYVVRFNTFLNNPGTPIEDAQLLSSIDKARARILASIMAQWFDWCPHAMAGMVKSTIEATERARRVGGTYAIGIAFVEYQDHPPNNQH
ncbi:MAG: hypothetical protein AAB400_01520 [Patescibacteria group bacterium]